MINENARRARDRAEMEELGYLMSEACRCGERGLPAHLERDHEAVSHEAMVREWAAWRAANMPGGE